MTEDDEQFLAAMKTKVQRHLGLPVEPQSVSVAATDAFTELKRAQDQAFRFLRSMGARPSASVAVARPTVRRTVPTRRRPAGSAARPRYDAAVQHLARHFPPVASVVDDGVLELELTGPVGHRDGDRGIFSIGVEAVLARHRGVGRMMVYIDSEGGSVKEAEKIFNILRRHPATVCTVARDLCASCATLLLAAGDC